MKRVALLMVLLPVFIAVTAQPQQPFTWQEQVFIDTVAALACPAVIAQNEQHEWDFSSLPLIDTAPLLSHLLHGQSQMMITEGSRYSYFEVRPDGNYFTGWEDNEKKVRLHRGYNRQPSLLVLGHSYAEPYAAAGEYIKSGITTAITGTYSLEVVSTSPLLLPDGRRFCAATLVKTIDSYKETSCNTTDVQIEKHLWYVPYYPLPVFAVIETAYTALTALPLIMNMTNRTA